MIDAKPAEIITRQCKKCLEIKHIDEFRIASKLLSHLHHYSCRKCDNAASRKWNQDNKERVKQNKQKPEYREWNRRYSEKRRKLDPVYHAKAARQSNLKSEYGIDLNQYIEMYKSQNGKCKLCLREGVCCDGTLPQQGRGPRSQILMVDHNHSTGRVRGLLCNQCNVAIGLFKDSAELLKKAITYLEV